MADSAALRWRLVLGPVLIAVLAAVFWFDARAGDAAPCLLVLALLLAVRGTWEYCDLLRDRAAPPHFGLLCGLGAIVVASNWLPAFSSGWGTDGSSVGRLGPTMLTYAIGVMILFGAALLRYRSPGGNLESLALEALGLSYISVLLSATAQLRWVAGPDLCYLPLASVVVVTKCGDTSAFFTGRAIGGKKLSPLISPGKTWSGAIGGLAGAALGGWLCLSIAPLWFGAQPAAAHWALLYGIVIGGLGIVGDLAESLIKRDVGRKDSAPLLPGFGGLLDLLDSVIYVGPAAYLLWMVLPLPR